MVEEKILQEKCKKAIESKIQYDKMMAGIQYDKMMAGDHSIRENPDQVIINMLDFLITYELRGNHFNLLDIWQDKDKKDFEVQSLDH